MDRCKVTIIKLKYGNIYNCYAFNEGRKGEKMNRRDILKPTIVVLLALILSITASAPWEIPLPKQPQPRSHCS